jgi:hypothetical protein
MAEDGKEFEMNTKINRCILATNKYIESWRVCQTRRLGPSWPSLTEFDPSLIEFAGFRVSNPILQGIYKLTRKIRWFYELTREFDNLGDEYKVFKCGSEWWEEDKERELIHSQFGEVIRVFIIKVIQIGIPWQTLPLMYLQHQYTLKGASQ